jgi:excinuclease ABC subunit A
MDEKKCSSCNGMRLNKESLNFRVDNLSIAKVSSMDLDDLYSWIDQLNFKLSDSEKIVAEEIIKEIKSRLEFLLNVGLNYLSLGRSSKSLSGGEAQRIRLATQIGSKLVGVLYILDEPSIGLHQRDNEKLINSLEVL